MIGYLSGTVLANLNNKILLKINNNLGYEIYYPHLVVPNTEISLFICQIFRETGSELYGFEDFESRQFFDLLLTVKGVGPKSAYTLIANLGAAQITNAVLLDNKKMLSSVPGIGPKASAQIILDLKDKVGKIATPKIAISKSIKKESTPIIQNSEMQIFHESLAACNDLGFKEEEVISKINTIISNGAKDSSEVVKLVLQRMG